jgi:hypothetical protein
MKTNIFLFISLFFISLDTTAYDFAVHVDPTLAKMEKERDDKCSNIPNFGQEMKCLDKARYEQEQSGELRGTHEYCEKHYYPLNNSMLEEKLTELVKKFDTARTAGDVSPRMQGEMEQSAYGAEIECVMKEVKKRKIRIKDPAIRRAVHFHYL